MAGIVRERFRRYGATPGTVLKQDDVLLLRGEPEGLEQLISHARLSLASPAAEGGGDLAVVEGVITENSPLIGHTSAQMDLGARHGIGLIAVSRRGQPILQRLATLRFHLGDVLVLRSTSPALPEALGELRILPLAERAIALGNSRRSWLPLAVLAVAMGTVAFHVVPVSIAFFGAAVVLLLLRFMTMHDAYRTVEWHILFLLGALIPLSHAIRSTGGTDLLAHGLETLVHGLSPTGTLAVIIVIAMAVTPFFHNAPTVLVMGPIAGTLAVKLGLNPRRVPEGRGPGGRVRLPHTHRAPVQHARHGSRRLPLRRLREAGPAPVDPGRRRGRAADLLGLAADRGPLRAGRGRLTGARRTRCPPGRRATRARAGC